MKADVLSYPKMWYFLGLAVFKVELLATEVGSKFKKKINVKEVLQKKTRPQFLDFDPEIVAVTFFCNTSKFP